MQQPIFFNAHEGIRAVIRQCKEDFEKKRLSIYSSATWKEALYENLVFDTKEHKTYLLKKVSNKPKDIDTEEKGGEQTPLLARQNTVEREYLIPNRALAQALIAYDDYYSSKASNRLIFSSTGQFWSCPVMKTGNDLPIFTNSGNTFSLEALEQRTRNALLSILRNPREMLQQLGPMKIIENLMLPYPDFYYPNSNQELDGAKTYLNDDLLSFLLVVKHGDLNFQNKISRKLKQYQADYKLWVKIHKVESIAHILMMLGINIRCTLITDVIDIKWASRMFFSLLPIALDSDFLVKIPRSDTAIFQWLSFSGLCIESMVSSSSFLGQSDEKHFSMFFLYSLAHAVVLLGLYCGMSVILGNNKQITNSLKKTEIADSRISQIENAPFRVPSLEVGDTQAMPIMKC